MLTIAERGAFLPQLLNGDIMTRQLSQVSRQKALFAAITFALTFGVSSTSQAVEATDVICTGCVGTADLATGSVTSLKVKDGTIGTADLAVGSITTEKIKDGTIGAADLAVGSVSNPKIVNGAVGTAKLANGSVTAEKLAAALLDRITALEAEVALLKGPSSYSNATLKGTYKCRELNVGTSWNATNDAAGVVYASGYSQVVADGLGTATITSGGDEAETSFYVDTNKLVVTSGHTPWSDGGSLAYTVGADGSLTLDTGSATETVTGWVSMNGDTVVTQFVDNEVSDRDTFRSLSSCVRTAR